MLNASIQHAIQKEVLFASSSDKEAAAKGEELRALYKGIPRVYFYGQETLFNYLILDFLGPSLEDIFERCDRRFSLKTATYLVVQMISRIQVIHKFGLVYRDIKPDNFLMGRGDHKDDSTVFIVDFGMAKHFRDPKTLQHIPYREKKSLSGTARYMSINTHLGREQSRRDDMEAISNVLMYFLRGSLPWQGLKARDNREKYERIGQKKQCIRIEDLCASFPPEIATFVAYTRHLAFDEEPNYRLCKSWLQAVYDRQEASQPFDWDRLPVDSPYNVKARHYESPHRRISGTAPNAGGAAHLGGIENCSVPYTTLKSHRNGGGGPQTPVRLTLNAEDLHQGGTAGTATTAGPRGGGTLGGSGQRRSNAQGGGGGGPNICYGGDDGKEEDGLGAGGRRASPQDKQQSFIRRLFCFCT